MRTGDKFVSDHGISTWIGRRDILPTATVYVVATKDLGFKPPVPFLLNFGWKATNATIYGIGGQARVLADDVFGGVGIPLPFFFKTAIVPSAGFYAGAAYDEEPGTLSSTSIYLLQDGRTCQLRWTTQFA